MLVSVVIAALYGLLAWWTSGVYCLMITLALAQVLRGIAYGWRTMTGGDDGPPVSLGQTWEGSCPGPCTSRPTFSPPCSWSLRSWWRRCIWWCTRRSARAARHSRERGAHGLPGV